MMRRIKRSGLTSQLVAIGLLAVLPGVVPAQDAVVQWSGVLELVEADSRSGAFTGGSPGVSDFESYFVHPTSCAVGCVIEPFPPTRPITSFHARRCHVQFVM